METLFLALAVISWGIGALRGLFGLSVAIDFLQLGLMFAGIGLWFAR